MYFTFIIILTFSRRRIIIVEIIGWKRHLGCLFIFIDIQASDSMSRYLVRQLANLAMLHVWSWFVPPTCCYRDQESTLSCLEFRAAGDPQKFQEYAAQDLLPRIDRVDCIENIIGTASASSQPQANALAGCNVSTEEYDWPYKSLNSYYFTIRFLCDLTQYVDIDQWGDYCRRANSWEKIDNVRDLQNDSEDNRNESSSADFRSSIDSNNRAENDQSIERYRISQFFYPSSQSKFPSKSERYNLKSLIFLWVLIRINSRELLKTLCLCYLHPKVNSGDYKKQNNATCASLRSWLIHWKMLSKIYL